MTRDSAVTEGRHGRPFVKVEIDDKYRSTSGPIFITGIQALVRLTLDQRRFDDAHGLRTAGFVSGYPGSPLGGVEQVFAQAASITTPAGVVFQAGLNEEIAATAVAGTQLLGNLPGRRYDGVTGYWYGKNPGLDRAADAIRHANMVGTAPLGGALAWVGDDPGCKSSTLPNSCEPMMRSLYAPVLAPASVAEILELGLHGVAISRQAGVWVGMKLVADLADAAATVDLDALDLSMPMPDPDRPAGRPLAVAAQAVEQERDLLERRLPIAIAYAHDHRLNRVVWESDRPRVGVVAAGLSHSAVLQALDVLGLDQSDRERLGLRIIKIGMPFPLGADEIRTLTAGLAEVIVVEEKHEFLEPVLKSALYNRPGAPVVVGKYDEEGRPLVPVEGALGTDRVAAVLARRLGVAYEPSRRQARIPLSVHRTPFFCSGCPHNVSTKAADDALVGVGVGCHTMVALDGSGRGKLMGVTQMGGEGAHWFGLAPFTDDSHSTQNLGDGTFFHSGSLAIRAAVAAGVNITYRLLYNDVVAMTGGQIPPGKLAVPEVTRLLTIEGVSRITIVTPDPDAYRGVRLGATTSVRHRDDLEDVVDELAGTPGVTILLYDDHCAADERRLRKRGQMPSPAERVWINSRVCEGCGDCADQSSCLSLTPIDTPFGRKMSIHQSSCNQDFTCLKGDCPSFVQVIPRKQRRDKARVAIPFDPPEPDRSRTSGELVIRMAGIGGTGVVTVSQILQMAAHMEGRHASGLEQTGLAQKGGPVISDVRISDEVINGAVKASTGSVDVLLAFDSLSASEDSNLDALKPHATAVIGIAEVPSASMVRNLRLEYPAQLALDRINSASGPSRALTVPGQWIAERLFGDHMPTNMVLLGAAYQLGTIPVSAEAIEAAINLNKAAVETNLAAFRWGRAYAVDPQRTAAAIEPQPAREARPASEEGPLIANARNRLAAIGAGSWVDETAMFIADLEAYQSRAYAERYVDSVVAVAEQEAARAGRDGLPVAEAFARQLYRLMAIKDEYEVARLHLDPFEQDRLEREFGPGARARVMLQPPVLRAMGMRRKITLGRATVPTFIVLRALRRFRGTRLDLFGRTHMRRTERALIDEYRTAVDQALIHLTEANYDDVLALVFAPDEIRGYEDIKLAGIERYRTRVEELIDRISVGAHG